MGAIEGRVHAAMGALGVGVPAAGETVVAIHCPWSHPRFAPNAAPPPALVEGVARGLRGSPPTLGALSAPGFPTRYSLARAGYPAVARTLRGGLAPFDEGPTRRAGISSREMDQLELPGRWLDASTRVLVARLAGSQVLPFSGALRALYGLLPGDPQLAESQRAAAVALGVAATAPVNLYVLDAIQATHRGGELSGEPVDLGVLMFGTDPLAVDLVAAVAYGVDPAEIVAALDGDAGDWRKAPEDRPRSLDDITIAGDVSLDQLRTRSAKVERLDPAPERYPLPSQVRVLRSPRSSTVGVAGALTETFAVLGRAGISLAKSRETTFVIGAVEDIPKGASEQATIVFLGDSARGDYAGYSRIIRLAGRHVPVSRLLIDVPFAMTVANLRSELGGEYFVARLLTSFRRFLSRFGAGRARPSRQANGSEVVR